MNIHHRNYREDIILTDSGQLWSKGDPYKKLISSATQPTEYTLINDIPLLRELVVIPSHNEYIGITTTGTIYIFKNNKEYQLEDEVQSAYSFGFINKNTIHLIVLLNNGDLISSIYGDKLYFGKINLPPLAIISPLYEYSQYRNSHNQYTPNECLIITRDNNYWIIGNTEHDIITDGIRITHGVCDPSLEYRSPSIDYRDIVKISNGIILTNSGRVYRIVKWDRQHIIIPYNTPDNEEVIDIVTRSYNGITMLTASGLLYDSTISEYSSSEKITREVTRIKNTIPSLITPVQLILGYNQNGLLGGYVFFRSVDNSVYRLGYDSSILGLELPNELIVPKRYLTTKPSSS